MRTRPVIVRAEDGVGETTRPVARLGQGGVPKTPTRYARREHSRPRSLGEPAAAGDGTRASSPRVVVMLTDEPLLPPRRGGCVWARDASWLFIHTCTKTPDRPDLDIGAGESRGDPLAAGGHVPVRKNPAPLRSCRGAEPPDDDRILGVGDGAESDWHSVGTGPESATVTPGSQPSLPLMRAWPEPAC